MCSTQRKARQAMQARARAGRKRHAANQWHLSSTRSAIFGGRLVQLNRTRGRDREDLCRLGVYRAAGRQMTATHNTLVSNMCGGQLVMNCPHIRHVTVLNDAQACTEVAICSSSHSLLCALHYPCILTMTLSHCLGMWQQPLTHQQPIER